MNRSQLIFGLSFIALGVVLLLDQAGIVAGGALVADWWPVVIIGIGLAQLATRPRNVVGSVIVTSIGAVLLLATLGAIDTLRVVWPVALIGLGFWLVLRPKPTPADVGSFGGEVLALFDDRAVRAPSGPWSGQSAVTIFGDLDVDLRGAQIEQTAVLQVTTIFGDVRLDIPDDWNVTVSGPEIFGHVTVEAARQAVTSAARLHLQVVAIFGDVRVRRAATMR